MPSNKQNQQSYAEHNLLSEDSSLCKKNSYKRFSGPKCERFIPHLPSNSCGKKKPNQKKPAVGSWALCPCLFSISLHSLEKNRRGFKTLHHGQVWEASTHFTVRPWSKLGPAHGPWQERTYRWQRAQTGQVQEALCGHEGHCKYTPL